jgi:chaperonin GroES
MSDVLSQAAAPQVPSNAMPALPDEFMPRRPNLPEGQLGEPKLEEPPDRERQPLLRPELVESIADRIARKNLAEGMEITERELLASTAKREYKIDDDTRAEWKTKYRDWLDFALQIGKPKNYPWQNASNVIFPLITVAALQFNARAYPAVVMGRDVVKGSVEGDDRGIAAVDPQTQQPMIDPQTKQPHWIIPPALRVVVNYHARSFEDAARVSEEIDFYPWEIETNIRSGLWLDYDGEGWTAYGRNTEGANLRSEDDQAPITFIEQHRRYDLDGDGYDEPIIVTFARDSGRLARITVGFDEDSVEATSDGDIQAITPVRFYTKFGFIPNPDDSPYDIGFGNLLYPLNDAINTSLNQMFDAGHLANAGGGFIGAGASLNSGSIRFMTGEYKVVNTPGRTLRENLVPLEFPGPNQVLFQLLEFLVAAAKEIASINDVLSGEIPGANVPGILGLAVIQQGLKVFNAVFKRVHRALRSEYEKLFRLNRLYLPDMAGFRMGSQYFQITRADYALGGGVEPVSDPEMVTDVQQMAQANFLAQFMGDPTFDQREIRLRMLQAACIQQIDKILAPQSPPNGEMLAKMAELDLAQQQVATQKQLVELRAKELEIRALHQEAELAIRRGKDKALEIKDLSAAILNLANAKKADHEVDQDWYALQLTNLRHQIDLLNTITVPTGEDDTGSAVAAIAAPTLSQLRGTPAPGAAGGGVPGV